MVLVGKNSTRWNMCKKVTYGQTGREADIEPILIRFCLTQRKGVGPPEIRLRVRTRKSFCHCEENGSR